VPFRPYEARYIDITRRLAVASNVGAAVISAALLAATWGQWREFTIVVLVQGALIPFNTLANTRLLGRWGVTRTEVARSVVNMTGSVLVGTLAHWPLPIWLWLPFIALLFDPLDPRVAWSTLLGMALVQGAWAVADGVPVLVPLVFTAFAVVCVLVSKARYGSMRDMLRERDERRVQVEQAHDELREAHAQLVRETQARARVEAELIAAQKLEAVGRLAAGIAHEINTPVQFIGDSVEFLDGAHRDLFALVEEWRRADAALAAGEPVERVLERVRAAGEQCDLPYLLEHVPKAFARSHEGLGRVTEIVRSMKDFAHPDGRQKQAVDLNRAIVNTLTIARGEYKHVAELVTELGELPPVSCHRGEISQVVLNLVVNAAHAIADAVGQSGDHGRITVRSRHDGDAVVIEIADTGTGIPEPARARIFEPFFTTKEMGRGTGQGLAIARSVVCQHGGELTFETETGRGTTFRIRIPVDEGMQAAA